MVVCLVRGADNLHMVQLMPLPLHHLLLHYHPDWFTFLMPAYPGCPGTEAAEWVASKMDVSLLRRPASVHCTW